MFAQRVQGKLQKEEKSDLRAIVFVQTKVAYQKLKYNIPDSGDFR